MEYFLIIISAIFVNNIVLAQFLGICPYLGVSNKLSTATGMSMAVCFVITLATLVTFLINKYLLVPFQLEFLQTIAFILVIAALVQMVEIVLKKVSPSLYQALGIFLPLITTNCAVLGVAITVVTKEFTFGLPSHLLNLGEALVYCDFPGLRPGDGHLRGHPRAPRPVRRAQGVQGRSDRPGERGYPRAGLHGLQRHGQVNNQS